jgi:hypothetical protein
MICPSMISGGSISTEVGQAAEKVARDLVRFKHTNGALYVNLPVLYPDGSHVTVRIDQSASGVRVSDAGFAYREVEDIGSARGFRRVANKIAEAAGVSVGERAIYTDGDLETLERCIYDVAAASWRVVDAFWERAFEEDELELTDELNARLRTIFGDKVEEGANVLGASTTMWTVSALVTVDGLPAVFQAVSEHANSINRASTAFRDLSTLEHAPKLVAFVRSKAALGPRLGLLAPGRVVEEAQPNEYFLRAAA